MSPDTAIRCALAFGVRADFWLSLQSNWDCFQAWRTLRHSDAVCAIDGVTAVADTATAQLPASSSPSSH
jgi:plasmid maintenance system antidote protein VapI